MKSKAIIIVLIIVVVAGGVFLFSKTKKSPSSFLQPKTVPSEAELGVKVFPGATLISKNVVDTERPEIKILQLYFVTDASHKDVQAFYEKELGVSLTTEKENLGQKFAAMKEQNPALEAERLKLAEKLKNTFAEKTVGKKDLGNHTEVGVMIVSPSFDPEKKDIVKKTDIYIFRTFIVK